jgi:hypothetical protein
MCIILMHEKVFKYYYIININKILLKFQMNILSVTYILNRV